MPATSAGMTMIGDCVMPYDLIVIGSLIALPLKGGGQGGGRDTAPDPHPARRYGGSPTSPLQGEE
jgi:hypothetical protein